MSTDVTTNAAGRRAAAASTAAAGRPAKISRESVTIIVTLLVATFVVILNETIMNVALQRLMVDLDVDAPTVQWLSTGFMLTMAVVIPTTGFILQRLSTRAVFMLAMGLFSGGTLLAALAPGFEVLLLARIVQACGTAIMLPLLMTTILTLVPVARRGAVMGNVSIAISVAPAMGPTVSGLILEHFSWRFMFVFVLPIALAAFAIGARYLTNVGETEKTRLDVLSVVLTVPAFGGLVYGLSQIGGGSGEGPAARPSLRWPSASWPCWLFVLRQLRLQRSDAPVAGPARVQLPDVHGVRAAAGGGHDRPVRRRDPAAAVPAGNPRAEVAGDGPGPAARRPRDGPAGSVHRPALRQGRAAAPDRHRLGPDGAGPVAVLHARCGTPVGWIIALHVALSLGLALLFTPAFTTGLNPLPPHLYSHGSAIMSTLQQVAGAAGTALLVSIYAVVSAAAGIVAGMHAAFLTAAVIALAAVVLSAMMRKTAGADQPAAN